MCPQAAAGGGAVSPGQHRLHTILQPPGARDGPAHRGPPGQLPPLRWVRTALPSPGVTPLGWDAPQPDPGAACSQTSSRRCWAPVCRRRWPSASSPGSSVTTRTATSCWWTAGGPLSASMAVTSHPRAALPSRGTPSSGEHHGGTWGEQIRAGCDSVSPQAGGADTGARAGGSRRWTVGFWALPAGQHPGSYPIPCEYQSYRALPCPAVAQYSHPPQACATAAMHPVYYVHAEGKVMELWHPIRGW